MWLELDYETASAADLKAVGSWKYMRHRSTRVLMAAYRFKGGPLLQWDATDQPSPPADFVAGLKDPAVTKYAFNADFEIDGTEVLLGIPTPLESWRCTMAMAAMAGLNGTLGDIGAMLGIPADKTKDAKGKALIRRFCNLNWTPPAPLKSGKPSKKLQPTPENYPDEWADFLAYNRQDVEAEHAIRVILEAIEQDPREWDLWLLDRKMNRKGIPVDVPWIRAAAAMVDHHAARVADQVMAVTGGIPPATTDAFRDFIMAAGGPDSLAEEPRLEALKGDRLTPAGRTALQGFQDINSASVKKYAKALDQEHDGALFLQLSFCGAGQSGRWSSKGVQVQNMPHAPLDHRLIPLARDLIGAGDYDGLIMFGLDPLDSLISCVRPMVAAPDGFQVDVCDLSTIEPRTLAWSTGCQRMLQVFADGRDCYKDFGSTLFAKSVDAITKEERQKSKPGFLGCGYGLGKTTLMAQAAAAGNVISDELAGRSIEAYRDAYPEVIRAWADHEAAVMACLKDKPGLEWPAGPYVWSLIGRFLTCRLPSGRSIRFLDAGLTRNENPKSFKYGKIEITAAGKGGSRFAIHGSAIFAIVNQATARDVLREGMFQADREGLDIRFSVHDELVAISPAGSDGAARLEAAMTRPVAWLPGVVLKAEGVSGRQYAKP